MAIKIKKMELTKAADKVANAYSDSLNFQRTLFTNFNEYYRLYRGILDDSYQNYQGRARLFVPYVYSTIETIMPRLVGGKPKIECVPRGPEDINKAEANTKYMDYQWDVMEMKRKFKMWVKQALFYGVSNIKLSWKKTADYDGPWVDVIDVFDFFIDPQATAERPAEYKIHRSERMIDELKRNPNYDVPKELEAQVQEDEYKVQRDAILGLSRPKSKLSKAVEVLEYWGFHDFGNGDEPALIVVANGTYVLRAEPNPYDHKQQPFIAIHDTQVLDQYFSIGEIEPLRSLQYELNDTRNQRMDNVTMILNKMFKVDKNADVDEEDLVSRPGGVIHTGRMDGIELLQTQDVTASSYNEETLIKQDMQQTSGVNDVVRGQGEQKSDTATESLLDQEAANERFKYKLDNIEDSLKQFGQQLMSLNGQFVNDPKAVRVLGDDGPRWEPVNAEDLKGAYDLIVEVGSTRSMSKVVRRAEARELMATVAPFANVVDLKYFIKYLLQQYDLQDIDEAFGNPTEPTEQSLEQFGGQEGAVFGGTTGRRNPLQIGRVGNNRESAAQPNQ